MDLIYFGSSDFSVPFLEELDRSSHRVTCVFTYRDKKKGRGRKVCANPVKDCALARGLEVYEIAGFDEGLYNKMADIPFDRAIVVSFGMILPEEIFDRWPDIWLNVHPSMLPTYRGSSPIISALLDGAGRTGVSINSVVYEVDSGKIYAQTGFNIEDDDNLDRLEEKAIAFGAPLLVTVLNLIEKYDYKPVPQGKKGVTYTRKIIAEDYRIDWTRPAGEIFNKIRAFSSKPGAYTIYGGSRIKILSSTPTGEKKEGQEAGTVTAASRENGLLVICGDGMILSLKILQPQGKKPMDAKSFINGYRIRAGIVMGKD